MSPVQAIPLANFVLDLEHGHGHKKSFVPVLGWDSPLVVDTRDLADLLAVAMDVCAPREVLWLERVPEVIVEAVPLVEKRHLYRLGGCHA